MTLSSCSMFSWLYSHGHVLMVMLSWSCSLRCWSASRTPGDASAGCCRVRWRSTLTPWITQIWTACTAPTQTHHSTAKASVVRLSTSHMLWVLCATPFKLKSSVLDRAQHSTALQLPCMHVFLNVRKNVWVHCIRANVAVPGAAKALASCLLADTGGLAE